MRMLCWSLIVMLGILAIVGWQRANSLSQELAARDTTIANLMASLEQAENKPPEIQYIEVEAPPIKTVVYDTKTIFVSRPVVILPSSQVVDLEYLLEKVDYGIASHNYFTKNPTSWAGSVKYNEEWVSFYYQIKAIILEIKERQ